VFQAQELALDPAVLRAGGEAMWNTQLVPVETVAGGNLVGMVAWEWRMRTPEYPSGRRVVVVSNDVSHSAGAFGPQEDAVFKAAVEYSLERHLPLVYLAANSGARFGVASEVRDRFKIQWRDDADRARGVDYLYLEDADFQAVRDSVTVEGPLRGPGGGAPRWKITGVIGQEDGLGVECLSGSGAIASAFARAYREGFTLTFVSARTVGIGAYLARLGHRVVQRSDQPIILTGFAALNKLLGRAVYTSHLQLGGPRVMGYNGVSHVTVPDDLAGARTVLEWLGYVPDVLGGETPAVLEPVVDPVERDVAYGADAPPGAKLNPRAAIEGGRDSPGDAWAPGLFDRDSWTELQSGWARTVITGLARLGGLPVGVVSVETNTVNVDVPADPGDASSSAKTVPQAGQIWFPDSAAKTAQAMEEFARQGLPLFILANWRGFSGGMRDLFEGVLQQGSLIVENLRTYPHPVFVYLPRGAELRGGAWVVVDRRINPDQVEMYADPSARGNVLEPEGMAEIKFREPDLLKTIRRLEPAGSSGGGGGGGKSSKEKGLLPAYKQAALHFMDLHDVPERMLAKEVLQAVVPWEKSRQFFYWRLKARLMEERLFKEMASADPTLSRTACRALLAGWQGRRPGAGMMRSGSTGAFEDYQLRSRTDIDFVTWAALEKQAIRDRLAGLRKQRQQAELRRLAAEVGCGSDVDELLSKLAL
jgi:acetyl-CoA carboxylase/biotin carboxylase 1